MQVPSDPTHVEADRRPHDGVVVPAGQAAGEDLDPAGDRHAPVGVGRHDAVRVEGETAPREPSVDVVCEAPEVVLHLGVVAVGVRETVVEVREEAELAAPTASEGEPRERHRRRAEARDGESDETADDRVAERGVRPHGGGRAHAGARHGDEDAGHAGDAGARCFDRVRGADVTGQPLETEDVGGDEARGGQGGRGDPAGDRLRQVVVPRRRRCAAGDPGLRRDVGCRRFHCGPSPSRECTDSRLLSGRLGGPERHLMRVKSRGGLPCPRRPKDRADPRRLRAVSVAEGGPNPAPVPQPRCAWTRRACRGCAARASSRWGGRRRGAPPSRGTRAAWAAARARGARPA